jgi:hypothetical protein
MAIDAQVRHCCRYVTSSPRNVRSQAVDVAVIDLKIAGHERRPDQGRYWQHLAASAWPAGNRQLGPIRLFLKDDLA